MARRLRVEFRYFDRSTCSRCRITDANAAKVVADLKDVLRESGVDVELKVTKLPGSRITESNSILINGKDIEEVLYGKKHGRESACRGCGTLLQGPCNCRTYSFHGRNYRYIPKAMIRKAIGKSSARKPAAKTKH